MRSVNIGIIGLGTVGGGVVRLIQRHHDDYVEHYGIDLQIKRACSRNDAEAKNLDIADIFTTNWQDVTSDPTIDIVIELIGGDTPQPKFSRTRSRTASTWFPRTRHCSAAMSSTWPSSQTATACKLSAKPPQLAAFPW